MDSIEIIEKLKPVFELPDLCGFEAYLVTRAEPRLKRLSLSKDGLKRSLKEDVIAVLHDKYLVDGVEFADADNISDNQNKYYIISQSADYKPFDVSNWTSEDFKEAHLNEFMGFFFVFRYDQQEIWCYQNRKSITLTNRKQNSLAARIKRYEKKIIFEEQKEMVVNFSHTIDILLIDECIITNNIGLLERSFDFQVFICKKAKQVADTLAAANIFSGMTKLNDYLISDAKSHKSYKKKMMKAIDSPVLTMSPETLFEKVSTLPRWKEKFKAPVDGKIPLVTNGDIESMIDLLIERFTVSEVTGQEYDTEVKRRVEKV